MPQRRSFEHNASEAALILFWPVTDGGLWDPEASRMVEVLEDELEVFVTCVGGGRGAMGLNDATAAASFMGCSSIVVVAPEGVQPPRFELEAASARLRTPVLMVGARWSAQDVADAYRHACRLVPCAA